MKILYSKQLFKLFVFLARKFHTLAYARDNLVVFVVFKTPLKHFSNLFARFSTYLDFKPHYFYKKGGIKWSV